MKEMCWACRQERHRRCAGCSCDHSPQATAVKIDKRMHGIVGALAMLGAVAPLDYRQTSKRRHPNDHSH